MKALCERFGKLNIFNCSDFDNPEDGGWVWCGHESLRKGGHLTERVLISMCKKCRYHRGIEAGIFGVKLPRVPRLDDRWSSDN